MLGQCSEKKTDNRSLPHRTESMTQQQVVISIIKFGENSSCNSTNYMAQLNLKHEEINGARVNENMETTKTDIGTKIGCKQH